MLWRRQNSSIEYASRSVRFPVSGVSLSGGGVATFPLDSPYLLAKLGRQGQATWARYNDEGGQRKEVRHGRGLVGRPVRPIADGYARYSARSAGQRR